MEAEAAATALGLRRGRRRGGEGGRRRVTGRRRVAGRRGRPRERQAGSGRASRQEGRAGPGGEGRRPRGRCRPGPPPALSGCGRSRLFSRPRGAASHRLSLPPFGFGGDAAAMWLYGRSRSLPAGGFGGTAPAVLSPPATAERCGCDARVPSLSLGRISTGTGAWRSSQHRERSRAMRLPRRATGPVCS